MSKILPGTRIRLNKPLIGGRKGCGTAIEKACGKESTLFILLDGDESLHKRAMCLRKEVSIMRDQTPNHVHVRLIEEDESNYDK